MIFSYISHTPQLPIQNTEHNSGIEIDNKTHFKVMYLIPHYLTLKNRH